MYVWGGAIKIGERPFWGRGVFVLVISNVNIGYQKSLTPPLMVKVMIAIINFIVCFAHVTYSISIYIIYILLANMIK